MVLWGKWDRTLEGSALRRDLRGGQRIFQLLGLSGIQESVSEKSNLPFLAEGWSSITITALSAGMVLYVWRYDRVVTEKERKGTEADKITF